MNPTTHISTAAAAAADPSIFGFLFWSEVEADLVDPVDLDAALDAHGFDASWRVPPVAALAVFTREVKKSSRQVDVDENGARYLVFAPLAKTKTSSSFVCYLSRKGDKATSTAKADAVGVVTCAYAGVTGSVSWSYADFDRLDGERDADYSDRRIAAAAASPREADKGAAFAEFATLARNVARTVADRGGKIDAPAITDLFRRAMKRKEMCAAATRRAGAPYFVPNLPDRGDSNPIKLIASLAAVVEGVVEGAFAAVIPLNRGASNVDAVSRPAINGLEAKAAELLDELKAAAKGKADYLANRAEAVEELIDRAGVYRDLLAARLDNFEATVEEARAEIARLVAAKSADVEAEAASLATTTEPVASLEGLDDLDLD